MKQITVTHYGVQGTGRTRTEAKAAAGRIIEAAMYGSYTPVLLACRNKAVLVYRNPIGGWCYSLLDVEGMASATGVRKTLYGCSGYDGEQSTLRSALMGLAQQVWEPGDGLQPAGQLLTDANDIAEFQGWARWQLEYRQLRTHNIEEDLAHKIAGGLAAWPDDVPRPVISAPA